MKFSRTTLCYSLLAAAILASWVMLSGCAPVGSGGPTQPLLPQLSAEDKFSDRFQVEEEPQFFYDLFGRELLEGNEIHQYIEQKEFDADGNLVVGRTGQLDSVRFTSQLDRTILTEDTYRGRHTEFAIGDHLTIKDNTLWPMSYIMRKTEFDGFRWDISFSQSKHLFSILNSRISNPVYGADVVAANTLAPTIGRQNSDDFIENKRLIGFRGQAMLGDILRFGFTYVNLHKEHPQRLDNPWSGTVANTPPDRIVLTFRDNSPEDYLADEMNGAKVKRVDFIIQHLVPKDINPEVMVLKTTTVRKDAADPAVFTRTLLPEPDDYSKGGEMDASGQFRAADGFDSFQVVLDMAVPGMDRNGMEIEPIDPRNVKSVKIEMRIKGDYWVEVLGYSPKNVGAIADAWPRNELGVIDMPFRDVIEAPGNDPEDQNVEKTITYEYGAARAAVLWGVDVEGSVPYLGYVQAQYAENPKYKQYPTIPEDQIGYSQLAADNPDDPAARTFSATEGESFEAKAAGEENDGRDKAWFINMKQRFGKFFLEESFFHVDPGWTTTYPGWGAYASGDSERDETYSIPRTTAATDGDPWDDEDYTLVQDDDDDDDLPDDDDFDGVLPRADDRDLNGVLDYQEDFLIFEADPPIFEQTDDLNNNRVLDNLEDDYDPDYKYGSDVSGYHLAGSYDVLANMTLKLGWLNQDELSSARRADTKYFQLSYERDIPNFGTLLFQNRLVRVKDDIIDYAITLRIFETEASEVRDELDFYDALYNTATLQLMYTGVPRLKLITKYLFSIEKHYESEDEDKIIADDPTTDGVDEAIDFMLMDEQLRERRDRREYTFNGMDPVLAFDQSNWIPRRYKDASVKFNTFIFKSSYEIPIGKLPVVRWFGEDITITPMIKWIYEKNWDRDWLDEEGNPVLDPRKIAPSDYESEEYLRFNQNTRETVGLVRLDYAFTPSLNILGGFQYRKLTNKDDGYKNDFLNPWGDAARPPIRWRNDVKTRIWAVQAINQGEWLGFNIRILVGFQRRENLPVTLPTGEIRPASTSMETYVRAMMGF